MQYFILQTKMSLEPFKKIQHKIYSTQAKCEIKYSSSGHMYPDIKHTI